MAALPAPSPLALAVLALGLAAPGRADRLAFSAELDASQTTPPNPSLATGKALLVLDVDAGELDVYVRYAGHDTSGDNALHIHGPAAPGGTTGPVFHITPPGPNLSPSLATWTSAGPYAQDLVDGLMYINLHTVLEPAGEIRGQIYLDSTPEEAHLARLEAAQVVGGSGSSLSGEALCLVDAAADTLAYFVDVPGLAGEVSAGLYGPAGPGVEGALLHALPLGAVKRGAWSYPPALEADLLAGRAYVQIATSAWPQGAVRGQVVALDPGTWVVDAGGGGDFPTIQAAVDTVGEGATIVVRPGSYAAFTIDDKALTVVAEQGPGTVQLAGTTRVENLAAGKRVLLTALEGASIAPEPALAVSDCAGAIRLQDCELSGGDGPRGEGHGDLIYGPGGAGALLVNALDVALVRCRLTGGRGEHCPVTAICSSDGSLGGRGGAGVDAGSSAVALYDCMVRGGSGGGASTGGEGGRGYRCVGFGVFASGTSFVGGDGGFGGDIIPGDGGDGGDALVVEAAQAQLHDCLTTGGAGGGSALYAPGAPGADVSGSGAVIVLPGTARRLRNAGLAAAGGTLTVELEGVPGDRVYLLGAADTEFAILAQRFRGIRLARAPHDRLLELLAGPLPVLGDPQAGGGASPHVPWMGVVPPSGVLTRTFRLADLAATETLFLQGFVVDAGGAATLASFGQVSIVP